LGYDLDIDKRLIINPREAEAVKLIFDLYHNGYGYSYILDSLFERGFKTKSGKGFQKNSLYGILTNPKYQGQYVYNRVVAKSMLGTRNNHQYKDTSDMVIIDGGCPQIVEPHIFEAVQKRIAEHKHTGGRLNAKTQYLLSGKVIRDRGVSGSANVNFSTVISKLLFKHSFAECTRYIESLLI
jgi:site-specific DNA recombinase